MRKLGEAKRVAEDRAAFQVMGFDGDPDVVTVLELDTRWRALRSELHPDKPTGDAERFDTVKKAYEAARFYALEPKPCGECGGTGKVKRLGGSGFTATTLTINCPVCKGSGLR